MVITCSIRDYYGDNDCVNISSVEGHSRFVDIDAGDTRIRVMASDIISAITKCSGDRGWIQEVL